MMMRWVIWGLVVFYLLTGLWLAILPHDFYLSAPGASETGPYNMHFMRDVGFAFITSSLAIAYGMLRNNKPLLVFGASWILIHGLFHLTLWVMHGMALNGPALVDAVLVSLPAILVFVLCCRVEPSKSITT